MTLEKQLMRLDQRELREFVEAVHSRLSAAKPHGAPRGLRMLKQALERERVRRIAAIFKAA